MKTRLALAQINVTVGDFAGNVARIVAAARAAHNDGAQLMVAPELALSGYPPEDLLLRPAFYAAAAAALDALADALKAFDGPRCWSAIRCAARAKRARASRRW